MKFDYDKVTFGDLDVEYNYINFSAICDGDNQIITMGVKDE